MQVRFWGVRGSCPAPFGGDEVRTRLREAFRIYGQTRPNFDLNDDAQLEAWLDTLPTFVNDVVGSNTACVEMRTDSDDIFILDMGSGLRPLGNYLMQREFGYGEGRAQMLLSHFHWDHIQGWPFFKPAYVAGNRFDIYSCHRHVESRLKRQQSAPFFPPAAWENMRATRCFHYLPDEAQVLAGVKVSWLELDHPSRSYAYRFEADNRIFVYASDGAYRFLDDISIRPIIEFFQDADLLVFDAQFSLDESFEKRSWGHSSAIIGFELACQANVKKMALFHHDPDASDARLEHLLDTARAYGATVPSVLRRRVDQVELCLAREGQTLHL